MKTPTTLIIMDGFALGEEIPGNAVLAAATPQLEAPSPGRRSVPASVPWVPSTAGILLAGAIVRDLIG